MSESLSVTEEDVAESESAALASSKSGEDSEDEEEEEEEDEDVELDEDEDGFAAAAAARRSAVLSLLCFLQRRGFLPFCTGAVQLSFRHFTCEQP